MAEVLLLNSIMTFTQGYKQKMNRFLRLLWGWMVLASGLFGFGCTGNGLANGGETAVSQTAVLTPAPTAVLTPTSMAIASLTPTHTPLPATPTAVDPTPPLTPPIYNYTIVNSYPHDPMAFTQGLAWAGDGMLYEGTGLNGRASLRRVALETGEVQLILNLPAEYFGEGIALYNDKIIQLTWQSRIGFIYDAATFQQLQTFTYPTEGWGITYDGERLIMSDGTATLYFWDPETLTEIGQVQVREGDRAVRQLNELEYVAGEVWANVWHTDRIARIDPATGQVTGWIDLSGLLSENDRSQPVDVLNGIAYDVDNDRLFVTGKLWPKLFEIEIVPPN